MFRKRLKKSYPPGTFISKPARICAIIQLCLAFSLLFWNASEPFIGEIFHLKSHLLFYQNILGTPEKDHLSKQQAERHQRNAERFEFLPEKTKQQIINDIENIQTQLRRSFLDKIKSLTSLFAYKISPYELAWIFFSITLAIMLLKRVQGASEAVWLLPLLTACYAVDSRIFNHTHANSAESKLFPQEEEIIEHYLQEPLSKDLFLQHEQLMGGWKRYLVVNWTNQIPSKESITFESQAEEGEFNFNLARLKARREHPDFSSQKIASPPSLPLLFIYFFWNAYFAYVAWKHTKANIPTNVHAFSS